MLFRCGHCPFFSFGDFHAVDRCACLHILFGLDVWLLALRQRLVLQIYFGGWDNAAFSAFVLSREGFLALRRLLFLYPAFVLLEVLRGGGSHLESSYGSQNVVGISVRLSILCNVLCRVLSASCRILKYV